LSGNAIDRDGATALAAALAANATLEVLILTDNYLGEPGALALAEALRTNTSIKELGLKGNEMGDAGVSAICEALRVRAGGPWAATQQRSVRGIQGARHLPPGMAHAPLRVPTYQALTALSMCPSASPAPSPLHATRRCCYYAPGLTSPLRRPGLCPPGALD
jgi:hypothetical protein